MAVFIFVLLMRRSSQKLSLARIVRVILVLCAQLNVPLILLFYSMGAVKRR